MQTLLITAVATADAGIHLSISLRDEGGAVACEAEVLLRFSIQELVLDDIRWYLEDFLEDASGAAYVRASRARKAFVVSAHQVPQELFSVAPVATGARIRMAPWPSFTSESA
jgi:hypothetical protein